MHYKTRNLILIALFAALTAVGAFIRIDLLLVSFTLQFLFCAFAGVILGPKLGMLSQLLYVFIGLIGIPIFTKGGGPSYIFQPSFGYLLGFIVAAYVIGKLVNYQNIKISNIFLSTLVGLFIIYLFGAIYLYVIVNYYLGGSIDVLKTITLYVIPFIPGDVISGVVVSLTAYKVIPILKRNKLLDTKS